MTKEQKERKIKIIHLILIVKHEYVRRNPFFNTQEMLNFSFDIVFWKNELEILKSQKTFEKGSIETINN